MFEELCRRHPELGSGTLRTLEWRIRAWRAVNGLDREVIFRQEHPRGRMGCRTSPRSPISASPSPASCSDCRLYHFRLPFSGFEHAHVVRRKFCSACGRAAECPVVAGWSSRAAPKRQPSAAFRNLGADAKEDLTTRYEAFCCHYGMTPTRNNPFRTRATGGYACAWWAIRGCEWPLRVKYLYFRLCLSTQVNILVGCRQCQKAPSTVNCCPSPDYTSFWLCVLYPDRFPHAAPRVS